MPDDKITIGQGDDSRASGRDYIETINYNNCTINQKDKIFTITIDTDLLSKWHEDNSINIDEIVGSIQKLKLEFVKNENICVEVETIYLQTLLAPNNNSTSSDLIYNIKEELYKCKKIKILLTLINLGILNLFTKHHINTILEILYKLHNNEFLFEGLLYWEENSIVQTFLHDIEIMKLDINSLHEKELKKWDSKNKYVANKEMLTRERENLKKYLFGTKETLFLNQKIKNEVTLFSTKFENFQNWIVTPFRCIITLVNGIEFNIFNIHSYKIGEVQNIHKYHDLFKQSESTNNILVSFYTRLILLFLHQGNDENNLDNYQSFFTTSIKKIRIEYDSTQIELRDIQQLWVQDNYTKREGNNDLWRDGMKDSYFNTQFNLNQI